MSPTSRIVSANPPRVFDASHPRRCRNGGLSAEGGDEYDADIEVEFQLGVIAEGATSLPERKAA